MDLANKLLTFGIIALGISMLGTPGFAAENTGKSLILTVPVAEEILARALEDQGLAERAEARLTGVEGDTLLASDVPLEVEVTDLEADKYKGKFNATLMLYNGETLQRHIPVAGRFDEIKEIPVPSLRVRSGAVISEEDVELRDFPASKLRQDTVMDAGEMIGKVAKRTLMEGRPVKKGELTSEPVIKKYERVTILFRSKNMELRTAGEALDNAAKGEQVKIRNLDSGKVLQAEASAPGLVEVYSLTLTTAARRNR